MNPSECRNINFNQSVCALCVPDQRICNQHAILFELRFKLYILITYFKLYFV